MFFTSIAPAITFAELLDRETDGKIGVVEVCLSSCVSGAVFSIFAGQPLVIVGVTGPVTILTIAIYGMAKSINVSFLHFYAWAQLWAGLMHCVVASAGWCDFIKYITNFSCHTFGLLIAIIYAVTGCRGIVQYYTQSQAFAACLMETIIALGTCLLAIYLANARAWTILSENARVFVADYAPTVSIVLWTVISKVGRADDLGSDLTRLDVPRSFQTTSGRTWFLNPFALEAWAIFAALIPAFIILVLFIFDHNVSSIMAQEKEFKLAKGAAYHLDFFVLGICIVLTGVLGIPPCNGLIPQAPLHTKSLCVRKPGSDTVEKCYEQRYTNLFQALLTGVVCVRPLIGVLGTVPKASLDGLFLFMALSSLPGNELYERISLITAEPALRASPKAWFRDLPFDSIYRFTRLQFALAVVIYLVTITPVAMTFPLFIAFLVYVRTKILPKYFDAATLDAIDPLVNMETTDAATDRLLDDEPARADLELAAKGAEAPAPSDALVAAAE